MTDLAKLDLQEHIAMFLLHVDVAAVIIVAAILLFYRTFEIKSWMVMVLLSPFLLVAWIITLFLNAIKDTKTKQ